MLLSQDKFKSLIQIPLADTKSGVAGLFSLSVNSVDEVNSIMNADLTAGAIESSEMKEYGFMQQRTIEDFDGHTWKVFSMDMSKIPNEQENG